MSTGPFDSYRPLPGKHDEAFSAAGSPREHWRALIEALGPQGGESLAQQAANLQRAVQLDGITYNVYADPKGADRPWALDPLPLVLPAAEWQQIAQGVVQRAELLDRMLADLYGPRHLLSEGLVPPALVFGHPGYLWPCQGIQPAGGRWLHLYAADLARSPDGRWWVIHDRTQAPSGAGYAMQNRLLVSRAHANSFRSLNVERLAEFFRMLRESLSSMAPTRGEAPRIVLLTPGPYNETYFEHSLLARHLGFPLVEGSDLTVREDRVFLKTLSGLQPVHAILRRLDDDFCDPAELRADSALGIPGLLAAVRAGNVLVANALGSGLLETTGLQGFLPPICHRLLGEPLKLSSVATWWCGEAPALDYVLAHLDKLVLKPAFPSMRMASQFGHRLGPVARQALAARLRATPHAFQAQEWVRLSTAPTLQRNGVVPRSVGLRVYALATPEGYRVMPGGLARVAAEPGDDVVTMQYGGASKDLWVLGAGPVSRESLLRPPIAVHDLVRSSAVVPSRIAENLFWLGRYAERCELQVRLLRAAMNRLTEGGEAGSGALESLANVCRSLGLLPSEGEAEDEGPAAEPDWLGAIYDENFGNSLLANTRRLQRAGNQVRERLSADNWHGLNRLPRVLATPRRELGAVIEALDRSMLICVSFAGFAMDGMTRDDSWRLLLLGRRIERLAGLAGLLESFLREAPQLRSDGLDWLLESCDSIITYRTRYQAQPELLPVIDLLVFDDSNPHALAFQLEVLARYLAPLLRDYGLSLAHDPRPLLDTLRSFDPTRFANLPLIGHAPGQEADELLGGLMDAARKLAYGLSDEIGQRFFSHSERQLQAAEAA